MKKCKICSREKNDFKNCFFLDCPQGENIKEVKNTQGGKREGAGRKKVIDYEIEIIHKRVKKGYKEPLLKLINKAIIKYDSKGIG